MSGEGPGEGVVGVADGPGDLVGVSDGAGADNPGVGVADGAGGLSGGDGGLSGAEGGLFGAGLWSGGADDERLLILSLMGTPERTGSPGLGSVATT